MFRLLSQRRSDYAFGFQILIARSKRCGCLSAIIIHNSTDISYLVGDDGLQITMLSFNGLISNIGIKWSLDSMTEINSLLIYSGLSRRLMIAE